MKVSEVRKLFRLMVGTLFIDRDGDIWVKIIWQKEAGRKWRDVMSEAIKVASTQKAELPAWGKPYAPLQ